MKKNHIIILVIALIILTGLYWLSPFLTIHGIRSATINTDEEKLSEYIEFEILRENLKGQLMASMAKEMSEDDNPFAALGIALGGTIVDGVINNIVTPSGLIALMKGQNPYDKEDYSQSIASTSEILKNISFRYKSKDRFIISTPESNVDFILSRRGFFKWKLTAIKMNLSEL